MTPPAFPPTPPAPADEMLRVLLVEDDLVDRMALRRYITATNLPYRLAEASSVAEARQRLELGRFDALIMDHHLPDGSGFELFAAAGEIPVIFVTGADDTALAVRALKAGAADYIIKDSDRKYLGLLPHTLTRAVQERRMRTSLRAAQEQVRQLLEMLPAAAFAFNAEGLITFYNRQAPAIWGYEPRPGEPADRFCGRVRLFHPDGTPLARETCWHELTAGRAVTGLEMIVEDTRGQRRQVLAYANPLPDEDGVLTGAVVIWVDITERRRLETQQHALESQLQHARRLEAVGTLAGGMAHEFNNLLTSILGNLQLAELDVPEGHPAQPPLGKSVASCRRARDLVARMLTFSESARGNRETFAPAPEVDGAAQLLRACLPESITVRTELRPGPAIACDREELRQTIMQLGGNAGQAMAAGGGTLLLSLNHAVPPPEFRSRHPEVGPQHTVRLTVRDTGPGMDAEVLAHLFEPFFTTRGPGGGTGLGLAGIYGIMKRQRGAIVVESAPGAGTSVHLFFPEATRPDGD